LYRRVAWGARQPAPAAPLGDDVATPRFRFRVVHTPGHAVDHVALFEPERGWLFSGDLYLAPRLRYLRADEDVYAMMDSLRRVLALGPQVLFCQHRGRVEQGAARPRDKLALPGELAGRTPAIDRGYSTIPSRSSAVARWRCSASGGTVTHASPCAGSTTSVPSTSAVSRTRPSGALAYTDS